MPFCPVCDTPIRPHGRGRPRAYCGPGCKRAAKDWAQVEKVIARARAAGDHELADQRAAWLEQSRADARHGWAGAAARLELINQRIAKTNPHERNRS